MKNLEQVQNYDPSRHLEFGNGKFSSDLALQTVQNIIQSAIEMAAEVNSFWPIHPKDKFDGCPTLFTDFYMGAAGVVWALYELTKGQNEHSEFCKNKIDEVLKKHIQLHCKEESSDPGSFFVGEAGVRAVKQRLRPSDENKNVLKDLIQSKISSNQNELLYGLPGSLLVSHFIFSEDQILMDLIIEKLLGTRELDLTSGAKCWTQNFRKEVRYLGAAHGTAGNYSFLLKTLPERKADVRREIIDNLEKILKTYAKEDHNTCNWPAIMTTDSDVKYLVHWCHGATGIVTELATKIDKKESQVIDELLAKAAYLVWKAGPLQKGVSICHGTSGSGMAMLKMFERTKDNIWLERAKSFAAYAIEQHQAEAIEAGQLRYSLWTGDLGLALFLQDVVHGSSRMPGIEIL